MLSQKQSLVEDRIKSTGPTFILSCERSGSTLLRYIVDTHPDIACPPEANLGELCSALYQTTFSLGKGGPSERIQRRSIAIERVRQIISALMAEYPTTQGKRFWCDKSPENLQNLEMLDTVFPDAKYICLYRNCMDVVHSCLEVSRFGFMSGLVPYVRKNPENLIAAFVDSWTDRTRKLLAFERANRAKCFRVTYEAIVLDTVSTLKAMFEFLGLPFDPRLPDSVFLVHHDLGPGDDRIRFSKKITRHSLGKGSKVSRANIPADLLEQMNAVLSELNYPIVGPDWDTAPSPYSPPETVTDESTAVTTVEEIIGRHLPALLKSKRESATKIRAVCKIAVNGAGGGSWVVNLAEQSIRKDRGEVKPDCIVAVSSSDFIDMMSGRLNPMAAVDGGKIRFTGDPELVTKIGMLLFGT
jgi:protein-tyrosine sulfotransferase